jgi:hypothetical protein
MEETEAERSRRIARYLIGEYQRTTGVVITGTDDPYFIERRLAIEIMTHMLALFDGGGKFTVSMP